MSGNGGFIFPELVISFFFNTSTELVLLISYFLFIYLFIFFSQIVSLPSFPSIRTHEKLRDARNHAHHAVPHPTTVKTADMGAQPALAK